MRPYFRVNLMGAIIYMIVIGWLLFACTIRIVVDLDTGVENGFPYVGLGLGCLGLVGVGFGRMWERDHRPHPDEEEAWDNW